jgi:ABC-type phosphate transport system substrate-binding protein
MNRSIAMVVLILMLTGAGVVRAMDLAIVVNRSNPVDDVTWRELEAIFELRQQFWKGGDRVAVIIQPARHAEKTVMLKQVYHKTDESLNKYLLNRMFKGEISDLPQIAPSNEKVKDEIRKQVNAIGFIDAAAIDDTVKVLKIDGTTVHSERYRLRSVDPPS